MSVHIRLRRMGKKKQPFYRIVAIDSRRARDGRFLETLGTYNPITTPAELKVNEDGLTRWLNEGALPSDTVSSLLTQIGYLEKYEKAKRGEDVSAMVVGTTITERRKKTRKMKKAATVAAENAAAAEAAEADAAAKAAEAEASNEDAAEEEKKEDTGE